MDVRAAVTAIESEPRHCNWVPFDVGGEMEAAHAPRSSECCNFRWDRGDAGTLQQVRSTRAITTVISTSMTMIAGMIATTTAGMIGTSPAAMMTVAPTTTGIGMVATCMTTATAIPGAISTSPRPGAASGRAPHLVSGPYGGPTAAAGGLSPTQPLRSPRRDADIQLAYRRGPSALDA